MNPHVFPRPWVYQFSVTDAEALKRALAANSPEAQEGEVALRSGRPAGHLVAGCESRGERDSVAEGRREAARLPRGGPVPGAPRCPGLPARVRCRIRSRGSADEGPCARGARARRPERRRGREGNLRRSGAVGLRRRGAPAGAGRGLRDRVLPRARPRRAGRPPGGFRAAEGAVPRARARRPGPARPLPSGGEPRRREQPVVHEGRGANAPEHGGMAFPGKVRAGGRLRAQGDRALSVATARRTGRADARGDSGSARRGPGGEGAAGVGPSRASGV